MKVKRIKKAVGKVGRTAFDVGKLYLASETGNLKGGNEAVLDIAKTWGGKNNLLQRKETQLDKKLSKYRLYRVGKNAYNLESGIESGDYTGAYKSSMNLAKQVLGKKKYSKSGLGKVDRSIEKYVLPTAQYAQDVYKYYKNVESLPGALASARQTGGIKNVLNVGLKASGVYHGARKTTQPLIQKR